MCNDYRLEIDIASIMEDFDDLEIKIETPEGMPNVPARADIKMTDVAPIVKGIDGSRGAGELVNRRWSWPGQNGKPVYNFRSEGREFTSHRCLILTDGFYEFTKPEDPKQKRQDNWLFTMQDHRWFCIAGVWRLHADVGEAFTMLTMDAGDDVAPSSVMNITPLALPGFWRTRTMPASSIQRPSLTVRKHAVRATLFLGGTERAGVEPEWNHHSGAFGELVAFSHPTPTHFFRNQFPR